MPSIPKPPKVTLIAIVCSSLIACSEQEKTADKKPPANTVTTNPNGNPETPTGKGLDPTNTAEPSGSEKSTVAIPAPPDPVEEIKPEAYSTAKWPKMDRPGTNQDIIDYLALDSEEQKLSAIQGHSSGKSDSLADVLRIALQEESGSLRSAAVQAASSLEGNDAVDILSAADQRRH